MQKTIVLFSFLYITFILFLLITFHVCIIDITEKINSHFLDFNFINHIQYIYIIKRIGLFILSDNC